MKDLIQNRKYVEILRAGRKLFWKHGFRRISVEEICQEAGVSKMTFYRFFSNKLDLAKKVLDQLFDNSVSEFRRIMHAETPVQQKMQEMISLKVSGVHEISPEFMQDFYNSSDIGLTTYIMEKSAATWQDMLANMKEAQNKGFFRKDLNLEFLFLFSRKFLDIANDDNIKALFSTPEEMIMEMANIIVYGISPRNEEQG